MPKWIFKYHKGDRYPIYSRFVQLRTKIKIKADIDKVNKLISNIHAFFQSNFLLLYYWKKYCKNGKHFNVKCVIWYSMLYIVTIVWSIVWFFTRSLAAVILGQWWQHYTYNIYDANMGEQLWIVHCNLVNANVWRYQFHLFAWTHEYSR